MYVFSLKSNIIFKDSAQLSLNGFYAIGPVVNLAGSQILTGAESKRSIASSGDGNFPQSIYTKMVPSPLSCNNFAESELKDSEVRPVVLIYEIHRNGFRFVEPSSGTSSLDLQNSESSNWDDRNNNNVGTKQVRIRKKPYLSKASKAETDPARALLAFSKSFKKIKRARTVCSESDRRRKLLRTKFKAGTEISLETQHRNVLTERSQSFSIKRPSLCELFYLFQMDLNTTTVRLQKEFLQSYDHSKMCVCEQKLNASSGSGGADRVSVNSINSPTAGLLGVSGDNRKRSTSLIPYTNDKKQQTYCSNRKELLQHYNKVKLSELYQSLEKKEKVFLEEFKFWNAGKSIKNLNNVFILLKKIN